MAHPPSLHNTPFLLALFSSLTSAGQTTICTHLKTGNHGCERYVKGFDVTGVTGVTTEVDLTYPQIKTVCDCIQACLDRPTTCANYVWKYSTPASVQSGHRTCTLYSNFNLPSDVSIEIDLSNDAASELNKNINAQAIIQSGNNPQAGGLVPQAFKDANLNMIPDGDAVSG
jgi:hypothetical protein